jgi:hypothetical protein
MRLHHYRMGAVVQVLRPTPGLPFSAGGSAAHYCPGLMLNFPPRVLLRKGVTRSWPPQADRETGEPEDDVYRRENSVPCASESILSRAVQEPAQFVAHAVFLTVANRGRGDDTNSSTVASPASSARCFCPNTSEVRW